MIRILKTWPEFFSAIKEGEKTFEIRVGKFKVDDILDLREFVPCASCKASGEHRNGIDDCEHCRGTKGEYTGRRLSVVVTYVTDFGQPYGQKVLGIRRLPPATVCATS